MLSTEHIDYRVILGIENKRRMVQHKMGSFQHQRACIDFNKLEVIKVYDLVWENSACIK